MNAPPSLTTSPRSWLAAMSVLVMALIAAGGRAGDAPTHRQHAAHAHGIGRLNLALEDRGLYIELHSPAANLFGFEHAPSSEDEHTALHNAVARLRQGDRLFRVVETAGCRMTGVELDSPLLDAAAAEEQHLHTGPEEHARDPGDDHPHDADHADITAEYHFVCAYPGRIDQLIVGLFEAFPGTEQLAVQYIIGGRQGAATLSPANPVLRF